MSLVAGRPWFRSATVENAPQRLMAAVRRTDTCWLWIGGTGGKGGTQYGCFTIESGRRTTAHRAAYLLFVGPIPVGYHVDHLCCVPLCVNPAHLEAVTPAENRRRQSARTTHCKRGHELSGENLYVDKRGHRACRTCRAASAKERGWSKPRTPEAIEARRVRQREYMRARRAACRS